MPRYGGTVASSQRTKLAVAGSEMPISRIRAMIAMDTTPATHGRVGHLPRTSANALPIADRAKRHARIPNQNGTKVFIELNRLVASAQNPYRPSKFGINPAA